MKTKYYIFKLLMLITLPLICHPAMSQYMRIHTNGTVVNYPVSKVDSITFFTSDTSVMDIEGNIYKTVLIGNQVWMAENLKVTKYADNTIIENVTGQSNWAALPIESKAYCWYDDNIGYKDTYGALYNWAAAMKGAASSENNPSNIQGVCPTGWHLPSSAEWGELNNYLGGTEVAGGKLKESGTAHWVNPNVGATNESGFTTLPNGYRYEDGTFNLLTSYSTCWSSTENGVTQAFHEALTSFNAKVFWSWYPKKVGMAVRCIKD